VSGRIARPYAAALFKVLEKRGVDALREVEGQLATVAGLLASRPEVLRAFEVPAVPPQQKQRLLQAIVAALGLRVEAGRLLAALEQHYRLRFLPDVVATFRDLIDRKDGMTRGSVEVPVELTREQLAALGASLGRMLGTRIELQAKVRPELLAGFVVRVGSTVYDGSLRTQLRRFAREGGRH